MSTIFEVLAQLEKSKPLSVSGASIAKGLNVSRTAVWKAVEELRLNGYEIEAVTNKGYRLVEGPDRIYAEGIRAGLASEYRGAKIFVLQSAGSTNDEAKLLAVNGAAHGTLIAAEEQTKGRGRFSRTFHSPPGTGLYMSVVLKPRLHLADALHVTAAAALAVCRAVRELTGFSPAIKWVNDIYLDGLKICGILTEASSDSESGEISSMVVGIGINLSARPGDFPPELRGAAGSIYPGGSSPVTRNALAASVYNELLRLCGEQGIAGSGIMREYRALSCVIGKHIKYVRGTDSGEGVALDIDDGGRLLVAKSDGIGGTIALNSGEVTINLQK